MLKQEKIMADEYAVMIDARDALEIGEAASGVEWTEYHRSWQA